MDNNQQPQQQFLTLKVPAQGGNTLLFMLGSLKLSDFPVAGMAIDGAKLNALIGEQVTVQLQQLQQPAQGKQEQSNTPPPELP